jgi:hypothetical protein
MDNRDESATAIRLSLWLTGYLDYYPESALRKGEK